MGPGEELQNNMAPINQLQWWGISIFTELTEIVLNSFIQAARISSLDIQVVVGLYKCVVIEAKTDNSWVHLDVERISKVNGEGYRYLAALQLSQMINLNITEEPSTE